MIKAYKDKVEALIPSFVDTNEYDGSFNTWFAQTTNMWSGPDVADFPMLTVTGVCDHLNIPTNFFEYTPWRNLNMLGPLTNDDDYAAIGHAHGWTNATTADGGDFFPASRDTWFTTDYGWENMMRVIDVLVWTRFSMVSGDRQLSDRAWCALKRDRSTPVTNCCGEITSMLLGGVATSEYATVRSTFAAFYSDDDHTCDQDSSDGYQVNTRVTISGGNFSMVAGLSEVIQDGYWHLTGIGTNAAHAAELYASLQSSGPDDEYYDFAGIAPTQDQHFVIQTFSSSTTTQRISSTIVADPMQGIPATVPDAEDRRRPNPPDRSPAGCSHARSPGPGDASSRSSDNRCRP